MALTTLFAPTAEQEFEHRVVDLRRVVRVVSGGRRFRFRATVIIGDKKGRVGLGVAKARDVQQAVAKATEAAKKHVVRARVRGGTVPHEQMSRFRGSSVLLKPAPEGSGIIAGGPVRVVAMLAGIQNVSGKILGSRNRVNVVKATLKALSSMQSAPSRSSALRAEGAKRHAS